MCSTARSATAPLLRVAEREETYLDASELRHALAELDADYRSIAAVNSAAARGTGDDLRIVPVFLFHLGADAPLLDGTRVARGFEDMVLAVRSNSESRTSREPSSESSGECGARRVVAASAALVCGAGRTIGVDASGARRATLAVLLQRIWGVASTRVAWDAARVAPARDELWSLSRTPFGPFRGEGGSDGGDGERGADGDGEGWTSFAQRDAALRNVVLSEIDAALAPLRVDGVIASLPAARHETIERTLARTASFLSLHNMQRALESARVLQRDVADAARDGGARSRATSSGASCAELGASARSSIVSVVLNGAASALLGALAVGALRRCA